MQRALVAVLLFALALGSALVALRARRRRDQAIMGGLALLLVLAAAGVLWWPFGGGTPAPLASSVRLYVGTHDSMVALQASTGSVVWTFPAAFGTGQPPAVVGGVAYYVVRESGVMPESGTVYAINAKNGSLLWHTRLNGAGGYSTPAVDGGVVYVSSRKGVDALNARDGSRRWHVELDTSASNPSAPTLTGGMLYFGAGWQDSIYPPRPPTAACLCLYALRASDGSVVWTYPTSDFVYDAPTVVNGVVYGSDSIDGLFALRASDGKLLWSRPDMVSIPTVVQGVIYVGGRDDRLHALSARDGSQVWQAGPLGCGSPTVSDGGVIYIGGTAGLVALRASDGKLLWCSKTHFDTQHVFSTPVVSQGVVFVRVYCTYGSIFCQDQVLALKASDGSVYWSKTLVLPSDPVLDVEQTSPAG